MSVTRAQLAGLGLILLGLGGVSFAVYTYVDAWLAARAWTESPEAQDLERQLAAPTPIWVAEATPAPSVARIEPLPTPAAAAAEQPAQLQPGEPDDRLASVEALSLESAEFRFLDPPEPGARARIAIRVTNAADLPSDRILLGVTSAWFDKYSIIGSVPAVSEDRTDDGWRTFSFPPLAAREASTFELHVAPTTEEIRPPKLVVRLADGEEIAEASPATMAPTPRPGPVMSLEIPSLKLKSGVVQTAWEAPPFTVGQIRDTAHVTLGNTVLVGHVSGRGGNIFSRLEELEPGAKVTATSRGVAYEFVVSRIIRSSNTDASPMLPSEDGRLTS